MIQTTVLGKNFLFLHEKTFRTFQWFVFEFDNYLTMKTSYTAFWGTTKKNKLKHKTTVNVFGNCQNVFEWQVFIILTCEIRWWWWLRSWRVTVYKQLYNINYSPVQVISFRTTWTYIIFALWTAVTFCLLCLVA